MVAARRWIAANPEPTDPIWGTISGALRGSAPAHAWQFVVDLTDPGFEDETLWRMGKYFVEPLLSDWGLLLRDEIVQAATEVPGFLTVLTGVVGTVEEELTVLLDDLKPE